MNCHLSVFLLFFGWFTAEGEVIFITNLPATVQLHEDTAVSTSVFSFLVYPSYSSTSITSGASGKFTITGGTTVSTAGTLSYNTMSSYTLVIQATRTDVSPSLTVTGTLTVNLIRNTAPTFTNLPGTVNISAKTTSADHVIFTVSYNDVDGDALTYTSSISPSGGPFTMTGDFIKATTDLTAIETSQYTISITASDGRNTVGPRSVTVYIHDINNRPVITNLPHTMSLRELTAGRHLIYDVNVYDADQHDSHEFSVVSWSPTIASSYMELIGSTGEIYLLNGYFLNYENVSSYTIAVTVSDGIHNMISSYLTLTLNVLNVNEAPYFTSNLNSITIAEGAAGTSIGTISALCADPDSPNGDTRRYIILYSAYSSYIAISSSTGALTFGQTWDYDTNLPSSINLTIRCYDNSDVYDDETLTMYFTDVNDNDPACFPITTLFNISYQTTANTTFLNLNCSDIDSGENAKLSYDIVGSGYGNTYFQVDSNGTFSLKAQINITFNIAFNITITVSDNGTNMRTIYNIITFNYTGPPYVNIFTGVNPCFLCTTTTWTLLSVGAFVVLALLVGAFTCLVLRCCHAGEMWRIRNMKKKRVGNKKKKKEVSVASDENSYRTRIDPDDLYMLYRTRYRLDKDYIREDSMERDTGEGVSSPIPGSYLRSPSPEAARYEFHARIQNYSPVPWSLGSQGGQEQNRKQDEVVLLAPTPEPERKAKKRARSPVTLTEYSATHERY
ncbi:hypothetical protein CHS0354_027819 [Potamilus streckersoni]|uniref:Cadherin domain-containing protein n=1 Tax=Potamilus streckersoni TaxID=2493646 RepID=A0AAE0W615_9BIVA|nr:hypothetical protein CHS0354_027819 [Potamilus streckersoni]